jgi:hypothetical protein
MKNNELHEKMKAYVALAEQEIAQRKIESQALREELSRSRALSQSLHVKLMQAEAMLALQQQAARVSQFKMQQIESGGTIDVCMAHVEACLCDLTNRVSCRSEGCVRLERLYLADGGFEEVQTEYHSGRMIPNVFLHHSTGSLGMYRVTLSKCDPCPSPENSGIAGPEVLDPALTMCDIWRRWSDMEQTYRKRVRRIEKKRWTRLKISVKDAFGTNCIPEDSSLFRAVCGFMQGSQEGHDDNRRFVSEYVQRLDNNNDSEVTSLRATKTGRKGLLAQIVSFMYNGEVAQELEVNFLRKKRFSTVKLARVSDMNSSFNPSALGAIASCEGGKAKGEVGLLCGESTLRRCMDKVLILAQKLGFYYLPPEHGGSIWCWGDATGLLRGAINRYVKTMYHDACCDTVTKDAPWIVPLTGDGVVTSKRGAYVTVLGAKLADGRLVQQEQTGKTMNQSSAMYTPIVAGFADEAELMPYFHRIVAEFLKIEEQEYCEVNDKRYQVHLHVIVIADKSFMQKYTERGGGSHSATCFCMFCGCMRNFKHVGYPGGCLECRALGKVYGEDGIQICGHYDACTKDFLQWQTARYEELCRLVPEFPLSSLPAWEDVSQLREECLKRCVGQWAGCRAQIARKSGKNSMTARELSDWIFRATRDDATLSNSPLTGVMYCPISVVVASLRSRNVAIAPGKSDLFIRVHLRDILQLEQELTRMTLHMKDDRFSASHPSAKSISVDRLVLCMLHLPMRTHEKVLTLLLQHACHNKTPKKSTPILDDMVSIIRRLAKSKPTWTYKWNKASTCVEKVKMHWDQSKHIFTHHNMGDLKKLVKLAISGSVEQSNWNLFLDQYIKLITLLTVSRDYTSQDIYLLQAYQDETYRLLRAHCGGTDAITNYFHDLGSGHLVWMCRRYGNIWRFRNEGAEAYNKNLSKRCNMFNSSGNRGNVQGRGNVYPFEVLGKWMGRYAMWQLDYANDLFVAKGGTLGKQEICYDVDAEIWEYNSDVESEGDDDQYCIEDNLSCDDESGSDLDAFTLEDAQQCTYEGVDDSRYRLRDRAMYVVK